VYFGTAAISFAVVSGDMTCLAGAGFAAAVSIAPAGGGASAGTVGATSAARTIPARTINDANGMRLMEVLEDRPS
jgi:hypothetical protein